VSFGLLLKRCSGILSEFIVVLFKDAVAGKAEENDDKY
jgi:hypothetical protein